MPGRLTDAQRRARAIPGETLRENVTELARVLGWRVAHFRAGRTSHGWRTPVSADGKGFPDLVLVRERVLYVECKGELERLTAEQAAWRDWLTAAGAEHAVWRPSDWLEGTVERTLRR